MDSGFMMGDPEAPMIAGFCTFGVKDFDAKAALARLGRAASDPKSLPCVLILMNSIIQKI